MSGHRNIRECAQREQAAAYALGALEPQEADRYREHLGECSVCREQLTELQSVVHLLPVTASQVRASGVMRERVIAVVRSEAELLKAAGPDADRPARTQLRWRSRRLALLAAGTAAAAAVAVGALVGASGPANQRVIMAQVAASAPGGRAQVRESGGHAELVVADMPQPPAGRIYEVWLAPLNQAPEPSDALFSVTRSGSASVDVPGDLRAIQRILVTAEPLGGSREPTSPPIIIATLRRS